jgi:hypothetical protein
MLLYACDCCRAIQPCKGLWTVPAGFLEIGESSAAGEGEEVPGMETRRCGVGQSPQGLLIKGILRSAVSAIRNRVTLAWWGEGGGGRMEEGGLMRVVQGYPRAGILRAKSKPNPKV